MGLVVGVICFCLAGMMVFRAIQNRKTIKGIADWLPAVGEVLDNIQEREAKHDPETTLIQTLRYKYQVNAREYTSQLRFNYDNIFGLNRWVAKYNPGDTIEVLYDPADPQKSTLTHFDHDVLNEPLIFALGLTMLGIITTVISLAYA